jgi:hypothetical protein
MGRGRGEREGGRGGASQNCYCHMCRNAANSHYAKPNTVLIFCGTVQNSHFTKYCIKWQECMQNLPKFCNINYSARHLVPHLVSRFEMDTLREINPRGMVKEPGQTRSQIHERTVSLRFLDIILRVLRLEVSVCNVYIYIYITLLKSVSTGDCE